MCLSGCSSSSATKTKASKKKAASKGTGSKGKVVKNCAHDKFVLKHEMVATQPSNRGRTRIGIGEKVKISTDPSKSVSWKIVGENGQKGRLSSTSGSSTTYTAHDRSVSVTIEAKNAQCTQTVTFTVVQMSSGTIAHATDVSAISATMARVGFIGTPCAQPTDVSFVNVDYKEGACPAVCTGVWASANGDPHAPTASWIPYSSTVDSHGTNLNGADTVDIRSPLSLHPAAGTTNGSWFWPIPWRAQVRGGGVNGEYNFATLNHLATYTASTRIISMTKGGSSATRTIP